MKKFMVVYTVEGNHGASFRDTYDEARNTKMDVECGLGGYAEIYERKSRKDIDQVSEYVFLEA